MYMYIYMYMYIMYMYIKSIYSVQVTTSEKEQCSNEEGAGKGNPEDKAVQSTSL